MHDREVGRKLQGPHPALLTTVKAKVSFRTGIAATWGVFLTWLAAGVFSPEGVRGWLFSSWAFGAVVVLMVASLVWSIFKRAPSARSVRVWGSLILHASFVLLAAGCVYYRVMSWSRVVEVTEGQTRELPAVGVELRVNRVFPVYWEDGFNRGDAADVTVMEDRLPRKRQVVHVNNPIRLRGYRILLEEHGYAPFIAFDMAGVPEGHGAYVSFRNVSKDRTARWWRGFGFQDLGLAGSAVFYPSSEGYFVQDPFLNLVLADRAGRKVFSGRVKQHEKAKSGEFSVSLGEVRYWASFRVNRDAGLAAIFTSFWLAAVGASVALLPRAFGRHG